MTKNELMQRERLRESIARELGSTFMDALADPEVFEIALNPDSKLWVEKAGQGWVYTGTHIPDFAAVSALSTCASMLDTTLDKEHPIVEGEFPLDGSRLEGLIGPVVEGPTFTIRKKAVSVFSLNTYVEKGIIRPFDATHRAALSKKYVAQESGVFMPKHPVDAIRSAIKSCKNILVAGSTGSGKTTLGNALLAEFPVICPRDRVVTIEDTRELQIKVENKVSLRTSDNVTMQQLLRATMRLKPNRIIVGEVRGAEALALLKAWNTGHPGGIATLHADSAYEALIRLEQLIEENAGIKANPHVIAAAVKLVLFIEAIEDAPGRLVTEIMEVKGYENGKYILEPLNELLYEDA